MLQRLFRSCTSISSSKPKKVKCLIHPNKYLTHFCQEESCQQPYMCSSCLPTHDNSHSAQLISIKDFFKSTSPPQTSNIAYRNVDEMRNYFVKLINDVQIELEAVLDNLKEKVESFFDRIENSYKSNTACYSELENLKARIESLNSKDLKRLITLSKRLDHSIEKVNLDQNNFTPIMTGEFKKILDHFRHQLQPKLGSLFEVPAQKNLDFKKLKLDHTFTVPGSNGVGYEATDYIPEWNLLAIGTYHDRKGDLVLWDLQKRELKSLKKDIHDVGITYVRWIPERQVIVTCAYDKLIKIFKPVDKGKDIHLIGTLRGHTQRIRCMTYIKEYDLLITGGDEPDLKVWRLKSMKLCFYLGTQNEGLLGSYLMYIPSNKLLGVGFKSGKIRFYNLVTKQQMFEFGTDSQGRYPCGLQLIPKRNQIICNVREYIVKIWNFDELNLKIKDDIIIKTEGKEPNCALFNLSEDQIVIACLTPKLEIYDFNEHKLRSLDLAGQIKEANSLRYLKEVNKISICDRVSGNVCILGE